MIYTATTPISSALADNGLFFRKQTIGPELDLVNSYIQAQLPPVPRGQNVSVFVEPRLQSGFPDIVIVYWHTATANEWKSSRRELTKFDTRIIHYLATCGSRTDEELRQLFSPNVDLPLERLYNAGLIWKTTHRWKAYPLKKIFAVRRLIAIEAKLGEWRKGLEQALQNTWFASESYLLLANIPRGSKIIEKAAQCGVGIITSQTPIAKSVISARKERIPSSYASWLFNEWSWRAIFDNCYH